LSKREENKRGHEREEERKKEKGKN